MTARAVLLHPAREVDQRLERDAQPHLQPEAEGEALVHQRGEPDRPAVVDAAQHLRLVHAHVVEEDLVELGVAGDLLERLHRDAGRVHVEQEVGDALVLGRVGIGAGQQHHPVGDVGERRPHLLAVDHVVLAVLHRARLQRRQVGAGVGLGVALAPDLLAGEHLGGIALLLLFGAVRDDRRARPCRRRGCSAPAAPSASAISCWRIISSMKVRPAPAGLLGPGEPRRSPPRTSCRCHCAQELVGLGPRHLGGAHATCHSRRDVGVEPGANVVAKRLLLGSQREIHTPSCRRVGGRSGRD